VQVQPEPDSEKKVLFAGTASERTTEVAVAGPLFVTVCVYVIFCPAVTGFGLPEFVALKSAWVPLATPIVTTDELFARFVSCEVVPTMAWSVMMVPAAVPAFTVTLYVNVLVEFSATLGFEQLTDPVVVQVQPVGTGVMLTNVVLLGNASVKVDAAQLPGPLLVTFCV
jgi:hypothetical protein